MRCRSKVSVAICANDADEPNSVLTVSEDQRSVYCPEVNLTSIVCFEFHAVVSNDPTRRSDVFDETVAPLLPGVLQGADACVIGFGANDLTRRLYESPSSQTPRG